MFIKNLLKRIFGGRRVKKTKAHVVKHHAKPKAHGNNPVKKISTRLKNQARTAERASHKPVPKPKPEQKPTFQRTGPNPVQADAQDPAHSPGHRKMNWKKYQETARTPRKAVRP